MSTSTPLRCVNVCQDSNGAQIAMCLQCCLGNCSNKSTTSSHPTVTSTSTKTEQTSQPTSTGTEQTSQPTTTGAGQTSQPTSTSTEQASQPASSSQEPRNSLSQSLSDTFSQSRTGVSPSSSSIAQPSQPADPNPESSFASGPHATKIAGIAIGSVAAVVCVLIICGIYLRRRKRILKRHDRALTPSPYGIQADPSVSGNGLSRRREKPNLGPLGRDKEDRFNGDIPGGVIPEQIAGENPLYTVQVGIDTVGDGQGTPRPDVNVQGLFENREFERQLLGFFMDLMHNSRRRSLENSDISPPSYEQA